VRIGAKHPSYVGETESIERRDRVCRTHIERELDLPAELHRRIERSDGILKYVSEYIPPQRLQRIAVERGDFATLDPQAARHPAHSRDRKMADRGGERRFS